MVLKKIDEKRMNSGIKDPTEISHVVMSYVSIKFLNGSNPINSN